MAPNLSEYDSAEFPMKDSVFNRSFFIKDENYKKILKSEEDQDGFYKMNNKWNMIVYTNMEDKDSDDEIIQMVLDNIPHINDFKKVYIRENSGE